MIGFDIRAGKALDQIATRCARLSQHSTWSREYSLGAAGGQGGERQRVQCPANTVVTRLNVVLDRGNGIVKGVRISCLDPHTGATGMRHQRRILPPSGATRWIDCRKGEVASGIYGRHGALIDRLGLQCEKAAFPHQDRVATPTPAPKPQEPKTPPKPSGPPTTGGAVAVSDVGVHRREHGQGGVLGILRQNTFVFAICNRQTKWCQVRGADLKTNGLDGGFVYVDFLRAQSSNSDAPLRPTRPKRQ